MCADGEQAGVSRLLGCSGRKTRFCVAGGLVEVAVRSEFVGSSLVEEISSGVCLGVRFLADD